MSDTDRRQFLKTVGLGATAMAMHEGLGATPQRPNILFIITDQQSATMMSCTGNAHLKTPAMDRLAASGVRFERAYAANPVCLPARFSFFTGRMPSAQKLGKNEDGRHPTPEPTVRQAMGNLIRQAGYETVYGGKTHLPTGMKIDKIGFRMLTGNSRDGLADACAKFIRAPHEKPFLLVASFINPHDICYMAINDYARTQGKKPHGNLDSRICEDTIREPLKDLAAFAKAQCPPLPANHEPPQGEPECITRHYTRERMFRWHARTKWSDDMWRLHRWAYCRLTERVDAQVGRVLDAVRDAGIEENTLIVFTSDHGDHDSAHSLEHKSIPYEEAARIPLILSHKGVIPAGVVDDAHLVSNGLDLLPTFCDYAGMAPPTALLGASIRPLAEGKKPSAWRDSLVVESQNGRMLRTEGFKYYVFDCGANPEMLIDLKADPGETKNLAKSAAHADILDEHRKLLADWVARSGDPVAPAYLVKPAGRS
ncbi:sulfatase-like hydrolase/transferase [bacterium]|nr:sulfatase-like hydrolase/transferase [bacterium]